MVQSRQPGIAILHWFSGPKRDLFKAIDAGCWFSVNPAMIRSQAGRSLIAAIPRERLLTESDGPFVEAADGPATPWSTAAVLSHLAGVWGCTPADAAAMVTQNFDRVVLGKPTA